MGNEATTSSSGGYTLILGPPEFVGQFPVRQDITFLPADATASTSDWSVHLWEDMPRDPVLPAAMGVILDAAARLSTLLAQ